LKLNALVDAALAVVGPAALTNIKKNEAATAAPAIIRRMSTS
jgi:hypothetical protein